MQPAQVDLLRQRHPAKQVERQFGEIIALRQHHADVGKPVRTFVFLDLPRAPVDGGAFAQHRFRRGDDDQPFGAKEGRTDLIAKEVLRRAGVVLVEINLQLAALDGQADMRFLKFLLKPTREALAVFAAVGEKHVIAPFDHGDGLARLRRKATISG